jgi:hypothetical protein
VSAFTDPQLQDALVQLVDHPELATLSLPDLVTQALPRPWSLVTHRVRFFADVVVLRRGDSNIWAVMSVPTPVRGRPSTWAQTPPAPIPYADLPAQQRSSCLADGLPVRVGTVTDIVTSWLPTQEEYRNEELFEDERRIALGHLTLIDVLLDVVTAEDHRAIERLLADVGVAVPFEVPVMRGFP